MKQHKKPQKNATLSRLGPDAASNLMHVMTPSMPPKKAGSTATFVPVGFSGIRLGPAAPASVRPDHRAVGLLGQNFKQHGMRHAPVNDVN